VNGSPQAEGGNLHGRNLSDAPSPSVFLDHRNERLSPGRREALGIIYVGERFARPEVFPCRKDDHCRHQGACPGATAYLVGTGDVGDSPRKPGAFNS